MPSIYAKLSRQLLAVRERERERATAHMPGTVFTSATLKIVPTIKNLYHIQWLVCWWSKYSSVWIKLQHPFLDRQATCRSRSLSFGLWICRLLFIIDESSVSIARRPPFLSWVLKIIHALATLQVMNIQHAHIYIPIYTAHGHTRQYEVFHPPPHWGLAFLTN